MLARRGITSEMTMDIGDADYIFTGEEPDDEAGIITHPQAT